MRHWVYVHLSVFGEPLYVGYTANPERRTIAHRSNSNRPLPGRHRISRWFSAVARIDWHRCDCNHSMCRLEADLIERLQPRFNVNERRESWIDREDRLRTEQARRDSLESPDVALLAHHARRWPEHVRSTLDVIARSAA